MRTHAFILLLAIAAVNGNRYKRANPTARGSMVTLQNRAAVNTRLRVLYIDASNNPFLAETGRLFAGQTKSVVLPFDAEHVRIVVEKDIFFETWRVVYNGTLDVGDRCLRIVGITLYTKIHACK
jgi:hypothetical protein